MGIFQDFIDGRPGNFRTENIARRELIALRDQGDPDAPSGFTGRTGWAILKALGMTNLTAPPPQGQLMGYSPQTLRYDELPVSPDTARILANQIAIDDNFKELEDQLIVHLDLLHYNPDLLPLSELGIILHEIKARLWLRPQVDGLAGFNAITGSVDFDVVGTPATGFGAGCQEVFQFDGTQRLVSNGNLTGCPFTQIDANAKFWIYFYYHAKGDTGFQTFIHNGSSGSLDPGFRLLFNAGGQFRIDDSTAAALALFTSAVTYDENKPTAYLINVDLSANEAIAFVDGAALLTAGRNKRALSPAMSTFPIVPVKPFTVGSSSNTSQSLSIDGDFMLAIGEGVVPDKLATEMTRIGIGQSFFPMTLQRAESIILQRNIILSETSFSVTGKYTEPVEILLYADDTDGARGALVASSGTLVWNTIKRSTHTFTDLTPGNSYHVVTVAGDLENFSEGRVTMPATAREGAMFALGGCWEKPTTLIQKSDLNLIWNQFDAGRILLTTGDDGYLDNAYQRLNSVAPPTGATTRVEFDAAEVEELGDWEIFSSMGQRILLAPGTWSDHDAFGDDLDGTAPNKAIAQQFYRERYGNVLTFVKSDKTYRSFVLRGCRFIVTDQRSDRVGASSLTTQMFDADQKTWIGTEIAAAVAADQVIFLMMEQPINRAALVPDIDWEVVTAERTEIFDLVIDNGGADQTIITTGDFHARGINLAAGPFGTDGTTTLPVILAARINHTFAESVSTDWPDYWNNSNNGYLKIDITETLPSVTVVITPMVGATPGTPVNIPLTIA